MSDVGPPSVDRRGRSASVTRDVDPFVAEWSVALAHGGGGAPVPHFGWSVLPIEVKNVSAYQRISASMSGFPASSH
jgi:hypothetical protein